MTVFVLCHLACISLGLYKCWSMGLLPTESSDWLAWYRPTHVRAPWLTTDTTSHPVPCVSI